MPFLQRRKKQQFSKPEINFWLTNSKFRRIIAYGVERHLSQSRNLCVKCFADGELPQERKVYPAVQISHPAVTLGHIIQRAEQSVRFFFLPEATTEIQEVKNMSQLKKIQSSLLEMKSIYALAAIAMLCLHSASFSDFCKQHTSVFRKQCKAQCSVPSNSRNRCNVRTNSCRNCRCFGRYSFIYHCSDRRIFPRLYNQRFYYWFYLRYVSL